MGGREKKIMRRICIIWVSCVAMALSASQQLVEKPMVVVIPSYNNRDWYTRNLDSVFSQHYSNYRVIYIDDCSPDGTGDLVETYIKEHGYEDKIDLIKNKSRRGALANLYTAIHTCRDEEIIVTIDGDDWLKHEQVLQRVNKEYLEHDAWLTHGHYEPYPNSKEFEPLKKLPPVMIVRNVFRELDWLTTHLRTFYAGLFKKIKLADLITKGDFFDVTWDMAFMFPMLEMAGEHIRSIPDVLYVYNCATPFNDFKTKLVKQLHYDKVIRSKEKYDRLRTFSCNHDDAIGDSTVNIVLFSADNPERAQVILDSCRKYLKGALYNITVIYRTDAEAIDEAYQELSNVCPSITLLACPDGGLKNILVRVLNDTHASYTLFAHDGCCFINRVDLTQCIKKLEQTMAHGVYFARGKDCRKNSWLTREEKQPSAVWLGDEWYAWQFKDGEYAWRQPYTLSMGLYRTHHIKDIVQDLQITDPSMLEHVWAYNAVDLDSVGLFFEQAKAVVS